MNAFIYNPKAANPLDLRNILPSGPKFVQVGNNTQFPYSELQGAKLPSGTPIIGQFLTGFFPFFPDGDQSPASGQPIGNAPCVVKDTDPWGNPSGSSIKLYGNLNPLSDINTGTVPVKIAVTGDSGDWGCITIEVGLEQLAFWFTIA